MAERLSNTRQATWSTTERSRRKGLSRMSYGRVVLNFALAVVVLVLVLVAG